MLGMHAASEGSISVSFGAWWDKIRVLAIYTQTLFWGPVQEEVERPDSFLCPANRNVSQGRTGRLDQRTAPPHQQLRYPPSFPACLRAADNDQQLAEGR